MALALNLYGVNRTDINERVNLASLADTPLREKDLAVAGRGQMHQPLDIDARLPMVPLAGQDLATRDLLT
jgi:hypothetical protein